MLRIVLALSLVASSSAMCDGYCKNACSMFAAPSDTVAECSDCNKDSLSGSAKCYPGAPGYGSNSKEEEVKAEVESAKDKEDNMKSLSAAKRYDGVEILPFKELESDTRMKLVVFHWGDEAKAVGHINTMQELAKDATFKDYGWFHVDASVDPAAQKEFKKENLPMVFAQTPEDGIDKYVGDLTTASFAEFHKFRMTPVTSHKVQRCDSPACIVKLAKTKPVFLKMYEEWCVHCKKMKKHFQKSSNEQDAVHWVEVECSKAGDTCSVFAGNGFPKVKMINKGSTKFADYKGSRTYLKMKPFATSESKWKMTGDLKWNDQVKAEL